MFEELSENKVESFDSFKGEHLVGEALKNTLSDTTMICPIAYGDPCTIELCADGALIGKAGYANEDIDEGRWWIENNLWHRQWSRWAWGECGVYHVVMQGRNFKLFDEEGHLIDRGILRRNSELPRESDSEPSH